MIILKGYPCIIDIYIIKVNLHIDNLIIKVWYTIVWQFLLINVKLLINNIFYIGILDFFIYQRKKRIIKFVMRDDKLGLELKISRWG